MGNPPPAQVAELQRANAELAAARKAALNLMEDAILARDAVRASEERQAFLLRLSDALRPLVDPTAIQTVACRVLGEHLRADRVNYAEVDGDEYVVRCEYHPPDLADMAGRYPISSYRPTDTAALLAGRTFTEADIQADPALTADAAAAYAALGVRAFVCVPLVKGGRLGVVLSVIRSRPGGWAAGEVGLVEEAAERTWAAVERAKAEAALKASEEKYRTLFESMAQGYCEGELLRDEAGRAVDLRYLVLNPAYERILGLPVADAIGRTTRQIFPRIEDSWFHIYDRIARSGQPERFEHELGPTDSWYAVEVHPRGGDRLLILYDDITARKRAEEAVRRSEERLRLALAAARMGIWTLDADSGTQTRDANLNALLGLEAVETAQPFAEFFNHLHPDDRGAVEAAFARSIRDHQPLKIEFRVVRPDGAVRWLRDQGDVFHTAGTRLLAGACVDITEMKEVEAAVRASEERLRLIVESATDYAIFTLAPDRTVTSWSPGAAAVFGWTAAEMVGRSADEVFTPEDRAARAPEHEADTARRHGRAADERWHLRKGGGRFYATGVLTRLGEGDRGFVKVARDLTARKRAEDELEERVQMRTAELAAVVDALETEIDRRRNLTRRLGTAQEDERRRVARDLHDTLGQLQAGLGLAVAAARRTPGLPAAAGERLGEVQRLADELGRETHALAVRLRPTSLDDLGLEPALRQLVADWFARTGIGVEFDTAGVGEGRLPAEVETAVYRVVQEALTNVAKHAGATAVSVVVTRPDGFVSVVVEDDGSGFDPAVAPKGRLGLLGMRERVELVGGKIDIESAPGAGTTVAVQIPIP